MCGMHVSQQYGEFAADDVVANAYLQYCPIT